MAAKEPHVAGPKRHTEQTADGLEVLKDGVVPVMVEAGVAVSGASAIPGRSEQFRNFVDERFDNVRHGPYLPCREAAAEPAGAATRPSSMGEFSPLGGAAMRCISFSMDEAKGGGSRGSGLPQNGAGSALGDLQHLL